MQHDKIVCIMITDMDNGKHKMDNKQWILDKGN